MLRSVDIRDYMQKKPVSVGERASLIEALQKILAHKISGVCVVDDNNNLVGMLSELDCLRAIMNAAYNQSGQTSMGQVAEYMTREVQVANLSDDIISIATDMMNKQQRRRPVVENGKLIGQITCRQLLSAAKEFSLVKSLA